MSSITAMADRSKSSVKEQPSELGAALVRQELPSWAQNITTISPNSFEFSNSGKVFTVTVTERPRK